MSLFRKQKYVFVKRIYKHKVKGKKVQQLVDSYQIPASEWGKNNAFKVGNDTIVVRVGYAEKTKK